jgi:hypothetical protein
MTDESPPLLAAHLVAELNAGKRIDEGLAGTTPSILVPTDLVARICYQFGVQDAMLAKLRADLVKATTPRRRRRATERAAS